MKVVMSCHACGSILPVTVVPSGAHSGIVASRVADAAASAPASLRVGIWARELSTALAGASTVAWTPLTMPTATAVAASGFASRNARVVARTMLTSGT